MRANLWLLPALMVVGAALLALLTLTIDSTLDPSTLPLWLYAGDADAAQGLLSTIAGSMITVAGLGFSITIVAFVLASTQFGPRLLTIFMRDRNSQATLGTFVATFTFCVLVLRSIQGPSLSAPEFVPQLSTSIAIILTLLSVGALVYFFHHVATSIQAPRVAATVARDLDRAIDNLYPARIGQPGPKPLDSDIPGPATDTVVLATQSGYVQVIDDARLIDTAVRHDLCVRLVTRPGLFVVRGNPIIYVRGTADEATIHELRSEVIVGDVRTPEDDIEFSVRQLVEVALRSLSPAINDPFTAMTAIDWLSAALARLAKEKMPSAYRYDDSGTLRIVANVSTFPGIVHTVFSRIRHYGGSSPMILNRLLEAVATFGPHLDDDEDRALVHAETESVLAMGRALLSNQTDLEELDRRYRAAVAALSESGGQS
jgi:uncharacterized membrane protein